MAETYSAWARKRLRTESCLAKRQTLAGKAESSANHSDASSTLTNQRTPLIYLAGWDNFRPDIFHFRVLTNFFETSGMHFLL